MLLLGILQCLDVFLCKFTLAVTQDIERPIANNGVDPASRRAALRCELMRVRPYPDKRLLNDLLGQITAAHDTLSDGNQASRLPIIDQLQARALSSRTGHERDFKFLRGRSYQHVSHNLPCLHVLNHL